jgi:hypothetical protein
VYGTGENIECFQGSQYDRRTAKDLRPLERRLPPGWKKQKWTPPEDPYDPLKNIFKKKK